MANKQLKIYALVLQVLVVFFLFLVGQTDAQNHPPPLPPELEGSVWGGSNPVINGAPSAVVSGQKDPVSLLFVNDNTNEWVFVGGTTVCEYIIAATIPCDDGMTTKSSNEGRRRRLGKKEGKKKGKDGKKSKSEDHLCGFWFNKCEQTNKELPALNWCNSFRIVGGDLMYVYSESAEPDETPSCPLIPITHHFIGNTKQLTARTRESGGNEAFVFKRVDPPGRKV